MKSSPRETRSFHHEWRHQAARSIDFGFRGGVEAGCAGISITRKFVVSVGVPDFLAPDLDRYHRMTAGKPMLPVGAGQDLRQLMKPRTSLTGCDNRPRLNARASAAAARLPAPDL